MPLDERSSRRPDGARCIGEDQQIGPFRGFLFELDGTRSLNEIKINSP